MRGRKGWLVAEEGEEDTEREEWDGNWGQLEEHRGRTDRDPPSLRLTDKVTFEGQRQWMDARETQ